MSTPDRPSDDNDHQASMPLLRRLANALRFGSGDSIRSSLDEVVEESERKSPELSVQERVMLANLLKFGDLRIDDVMVPRADIVAVEESTELVDLLRIFREAQHSRLPVYRETLDDPIGVVHIKDLLGLVELGGDGDLRWPEISISKIKRDILFVPPSMPALDLLLKMQASHTHLALVIDEYGGTDGLVSIEDLVEEIVGDIDDEHDTDESPHVRALPSGEFEVDARIDLDDFHAETGIELKPDDPDADVDTLGGLVVSLLGRVPLRGEIVHHPSGFEFDILESDPRRIKRLRMRKTAAPKSEDAEQTDSAAES